jgi:hypothetical protein
VAAVVFAFGNRPGITADEALAIADALHAGRSFASLSLSTRIRREAEKDPDHETSTDIDVRDAELVKLHDVLAVEIPGWEDSDAVKRLHREVVAELVRRRVEPPAGEDA